MKNVRALVISVMTAALVVAGSVNAFANSQAAFSPSTRTLSSVSETFTVEVIAPVIDCASDCPWPVTVELRVLVNDANGDPNAASYVSLSTGSLTFGASADKQSFTVSVNLPSTAAPGDYQYQIKTFKAETFTAQNVGGYGHGPGTIINVSVPEVTSVDLTAPVVTFTSPAEGSRLQFCAGGTPLSFGFDAVEDGVAGSVISGVAANVNGMALTTTATGLGTVNAAGSGAATIGGIGSFTINASAANSFGLQGAASRDVAVSYTLGWLPPLALGKVHNGGSTVPVKFTVRDCQSNFVRDETVSVVVYEVTATGAFAQLTGLFGEGSSSVRIDDVAGQYIVNFPTAKGARQYRVDVYFQGWADGQAGQWVKQGSTTFATR